MFKDVTYLNGNLVEWSETKEKWLYEDGTDSWKNPRQCPQCKEHPTKEGHDACLGELPGVKFACCGHGVTEGYICFDDENETTIRFENMTKDV